MPIFNPEEKNTSYDEIQKESKIITDFFKKSRVKEDNNGETYLPKPADFVGKEKEKELYAEYLAGAYFPENILSDMLNEMVGLAFKSGLTSSLPKKIAGLEYHADNSGNSLVAILRDIIKGLLVSKRFAILADYDNDKKAPYLSLYESTNIFKTKYENNNLVFVSLSEDSDKKDKKGRSLEQVRIFRIDDDGFVVVETWIKEENKTWGKTSEDAYPEIAGKRIDFIPIRIVEVEVIPLLGAAYALEKGYQESANYYSITRKLGIPKLLITSDTDSDKFNAIDMGAQSALKLERGDDAKYVSVGTDGIEPCRISMQTRFDEAVEMGVRFQQKASAETGEALKTRSAAKEVKLSDLVQLAIEELAEALRVCALMVGSDPDKVILKMDVELVEKPLDKNTVEMYEKGTLQGNIAQEDMWRYLHNQGHIIVPIKNNELDFNAYRKKIKNGEAI